MKKNYIVFTVLTLIFAICIIINYEYNLETKKQFGQNLEWQFGNMLSNAEGLKTYIEKNPKIDNRQLYIFSGELISDLNLFQTYMGDDMTVFSHYRDVKDYIDSAVNTNDISKVKASMIHELDEIIAFNINLRKQCANNGDYRRHYYLNWYNLYEKHKLK